MINMIATWLQMKWCKHIFNARQRVQECKSVCAYARVWESVSLVVVGFFFLVSFLSLSVRQSSKDPPKMPQAMPPANQSLKSSPRQGQQSPTPLSHHPCHHLFDFLYVKKKPKKHNTPKRRKIATTSLAPARHIVALMKATPDVWLEILSVFLCDRRYGKRESLFTCIGWIRWQVSYSPTYLTGEKSEEKMRTRAACEWLFASRIDVWEIWAMEWWKNEGRGDEREGESLSDQGDAVIG